MTSIKPSVICAFICAMVLFAAPGNATPTLNFYQVDFYQDGSLAVSDSVWGEFRIAYQQSSSLQFINVVSNPGTANASWIVQNQPLLPGTVTGTSAFSGNSYFDLGITSGTTVSSMDIGYSISSAPATAIPTSFDATGSYSVGSSQNIINSGVPSGEVTAGTPSTGNLNWNVPFTDLKIVWHAGMPNVVQETNWCGPGAAANSLAWLSNENDLGLTESLDGMMHELAENMENNHDGNWDDMEAQGKMEFMYDNDLNLVVHYAGGAHLPTDGNYSTPYGTATNGGEVTWDWIVEQMEAGQDVEIMTNHHWVVVEGLLSFDGIHLLSYRDDPYQNGDDTTDDEEQTIDDRHVWTYFDDGYTDIGWGDEVLRAAVAESIPEPITLVFFGTGLAGVCAYVTRRRTR